MRTVFDERLGVLCLPINVKCIEVRRFPVNLLKLFIKVFIHFTPEFGGLSLGNPYLFLLLLLLKNLSPLIKCLAYAFPVKLIYDDQH